MCAEHPTAPGPSSRPLDEQVKVQVLPRALSRFHLASLLAVATGSGGHGRSVDRARSLSPRVQIGWSDDDDDDDGGAVRIDRDRGPVAGYVCAACGRTGHLKSGVCAHCIYRCA